MLKNKVLYSGLNNLILETLIEKNQIKTILSFAKKKEAKKTVLIAAQARPYKKSRILMLLLWA